MNIRTAYFLDIDNLVGAGLASESQISELLAAFESSCSPSTNDLVFCAATSMAAFYVKLACPGYHVLTGRGKDSSDLKLLSVADPDMLARQFSKVALGSGDWIFHPLVRELRSRGLQVELLQGRGRLSHHLYQSVAPTERGARTPITQLQLAA